MDKMIKIFGLPRSGTNFAETVLMSNFKIVLLNNYPCWKHGLNTHKGRSINFERGKTNDLKFVVCTKNPVDWLWSLYCFENDRRKKKAPMEFLTSPSRHYQFPEYEKHNWKPLDVFNNVSKNWLEMYDDPKIIRFIKHEEFVTDYKNILSEIEVNFDLERKKDEFFAPKKTILPGRKVGSKEWKKREHEFDKECLSFIDKHIDKKVVSKLGY